MKALRSLVLWFSILTVAFGISLGSLQAAAKLDVKDLPEPVQKTIKAKAGNKTISSISKKGTGDTTTYTASIQSADGKSGVITVGADGKFVKSKEETAMKDLPEAVQATIKAKAGDKAIAKIEKKAKGGKSDKTTYAATVKGADNKEVLITVDATGQFITMADAGAKKASKSTAKPPAK